MKITKIKDKLIIERDLETLWDVPTYDKSSNHVNHNKYRSMLAKRISDFKASGELTHELQEWVKKTLQRNSLDESQFEWVDRVLDDPKLVDLVDIEEPFSSDKIRELASEISNAKAYISGVVEAAAKSAGGPLTEPVIEAITSVIMKDVLGIR